MSYSESGNRLTILDPEGEDILVKFYWITNIDTFGVFSSGHQFCWLSQNDYKLVKYQKFLRIILGINRQGENLSAPLKMERVTDNLLSWFQEIPEDAALDILNSTRIKFILAKENESSDDDIFAPQLTYPHVVIDPQVTEEHFEEIMPDKSINPLPNIIKLLTMKN